MNVSSKILLLFVFLAISTSLMASAVTQATAQSNGAFSLTVTPPVAYISLKPGESFQHIINVEYSGPSPVTVTPRLFDFNPAESGQGIQLSDTHSFPYLNPALENPLQQAVTLEPGQKSSFTIPISIPQIARTHEYHLTVLFAANPTQTTQLGTSQTNVAGTIGSNMIVLVTPDGRDLSQLSIKSVQGARLVDSFGQIGLRVLAANTGPTATVASGSATIKDWQGNSVQSYEVFPDVILANSVRELRVIDPLSSAEEPIPLEIISYDSPFLIGPYTFELQLIDTNDVERTSVSVTVWAVPFSVLIAILIGLGAVFGYLFFIKKLPIGKRLETY